MARTLQRHRLMLPSTPRVLHLFGRLSHDRNLERMVTSSLLFRGGESMVHLHLSPRGAPTCTRRALLGRLRAQAERVGLRLRMVSESASDISFVVERIAARDTRALMEGAGQP